MIARTVLLFLAVLTLAACTAPGGSEPAADLSPTETAPTAAPTVTPVVMPTQPPVEEPAAQPTPEEPDPAAILGNLTYTASGMWSEPITLIDGMANYDDGSSTLLATVQLKESLIPTADLDGDGTTDAIAVLVDSPTGTGVFTMLSAVLDVFGTPQPTEPVIIGDRINLKALTIDGPTGFADMITQGEGDAACCASWNGRMTLAFEDGRLIEQDLTLTSRVALSDLDGTAWRLVDLGGDSPLPAGIDVTAVFNGNELSGSAGCNDYTAALDVPTERPNSLAVSAISTTDMLCADEVMDVETAFLSHLAATEGWWIDAGQLALTYATDGPIYQHLLFEPALP